MLILLLGDSFDPRFKYRGCLGFFDVLTFVIIIRSLLVLVNRTLHKAPLLVFVTYLVRKKSRTLYFSFQPL